MSVSQGGNKRGIDIIVPLGSKKQTKKAHVCVVQPMSQKKRSQESQLWRTVGKVIDLKEFSFTVRAGPFTYLIKVWHQITVNFRII